MALRTIRLNGDGMLRKKSRPVAEVTPGILTLLDDLAETMRKHDGAGLAAPQVGVLRRVAVVDVSDREEDDEGDKGRNGRRRGNRKSESDGGRLYELINPEILEQSGSQINPEGCLSIPGKQGTVDRPEYVKVKTLTRDGGEEIIEGRDMLARALSHEIDHLDGILNIDKIIEFTKDE